MRILVIEDTEDVAEGIVGAVHRMGHETDWARDGEIADDLLSSYSYDLVLLDLMLPRLDGVSLLRRLRDRRNDVPVLVLTARAAVDERVQVLDLGADDYLCKPFDFSELQARIRSLLRRRSGDPTNELSYGGIHFNRRSRTVTVRDRPVALTRRELSLIEMLLANRGHILSKRQILDGVFGYETEPTENAVEVLVGRLRRKIVGTTARIHNHRGLGYQLLDQ
jgi:two-component system, OmpR family, response regulator TctD